MTRSLVAAVLAAIVLGGGSALGSDGSGLVAASPAPGASVAELRGDVVLTFAAPADPSATTVSVVVGGKVVSGVARVDPGDHRRIRVALTAPRPGVHVVRWRILTEDGHPRVGRLSFSVGSPGIGADVRDLRRPAGAWIAGVGRYLTLSSLIVVLGLAVFRLGVAPAPGSAGKPDAPRGATRAVAWACLTGLVLWLLGVGVGLNEPDVVSLVRETRWGHAWLVMVAASLVVLVASLARRGRGRTGTVVAAFAAGVALTAISWSGHASSDSDRSLGIASDVAHNLASAGWLGALVGLSRYLSAPPETDDPIGEIAATVERFSLLAIGSVAVIVLTGVYRSLAEVPTPDAITTTTYGWALVVKVALVVVMIAFGAVNRLRAQPRLARAALGLDPDDGGAFGLIRRNVRAEIALGAFVMVAVAVLTTVPVPTP